MTMLSELQPDELMRIRLALVRFFILMHDWLHTAIFICADETY